MLGVSPQKRPQQQDNNRRGVSRPRGPSSIRADLEATTYRPRGLHFLTNRRSDIQHEVFNRDITQTGNQNSILQNYVPSNQQGNYQQNYIPLNQNQVIPVQNQQFQQHIQHGIVPFVQQQQDQNAQVQPHHTQYLYQQFVQQPAIEQRIDQNHVERFRQPVPYTPLNLAGQYQDQSAFLQARNYQEGQFIQNQFNRQPNRFGFNYQNTHVPFG